MIHVNLDFRSPLPIHEQVREQVRFLILSGSLPPGEQFPSIRQFAVDLKINPNTVQKIYRELEHEGLLETRKGKGCYVTRESQTLTRPDGAELLKREIRSLVTRSRALGYSLEELCELIKKMEGE